MTHLLGLARDSTWHLYLLEILSNPCRLLIIQPKCQSYKVYRSNNLYILTHLCKPHPDRDVEYLHHKRKLFFLLPSPHHLPQITSLLCGRNSDLYHNRLALLVSEPHWNNYSVCMHVFMSVSYMFSSLVQYKVLEIYPYFCMYVVYIIFWYCIIFNMNISQFILLLWKFVLFLVSGYCN